MIKRSLVILFASLCVFAAVSQVALKTSDRLQLGGLNAPRAAGEPKISTRADRDVELIVRYKGEQETFDAIQEAGGEIVSLIGSRSVIVRVSADKADAVAACHGVSGVKLSAKVKPVNMEARKASKVDLIQAGTDLPRAFDGSGVVMGMYDIGLEPNHINFRDADGKNRIKALWHYEDITALATTYDTPEKISGFDTDYNESHGTHVLGVMSGSFVDPTAPQHDYRGVAPGAELVTAVGLGYNAQILDGMERIAKYAQDQKKPCVINISFGDNLGPHDGSDEFTEAINDIADKYGVIVCMAAGNERDDDVAIIKQFSEADPQIRTLLLKGYNDVDALFQSFGTIEIYGEDDTPFEVYLDIINRSTPDEAVYSLALKEKKETYLSQGTMIKDYLDNVRKMELIEEDTPFHDIYSDSFVGGMLEVDPYNHRYHCQVNAYLQGRTSTSISRNFVCLRIKGQPGKKVFVYCDGMYMSFGDKNMPGFDKPDGNGSNSNMGSGPNTIAVGSYVTSYLNDSPYSYGKVGDISWFSSYGETPDGRTIPEVCAPGQVIISSRNSYIGTGSNALSIYPIHYQYTDKKNRTTYEWTSCAGTSQASPHMAGIIALWLQADPTLTLDRIREIIAETSGAALTTEPGWGKGVVDAYAGLKKVLGESSVKGIERDDAGAVMFNRKGNEFEAFVAGASKITMEVYSLTGSLAKKFSVAGDTTVLNLDELQRGVYVVKVTSGNVSKSVKIVN